MLGDSPKEGILANPQAFIKALESIFGHSAKAIEEEVMNQIKAHVEPKYAFFDSLPKLVHELRMQQLCDPSSNSC